MVKKMSWRPREVEDFDAACLADDSYMSRLGAMLDEHQLLIIRGQTQLTLAQHLELTSHFGHIGSSLSVDTSHDSSNNVQVMERRTTDQAAASSGRISSSHYWHTDRSFLKKPPAATTLHEQVLPKSGGQTLFANMLHALKAAKEAGFSDLEYDAVHSYGAYFKDLQPAFYTAQDIQLAHSTFPPVTHPIVRICSKSGRAALCLSELCLTEVLGLPEKEGRILLDNLYEIATADDNIYVHSWMKGDLLIWSNFGLMHKGTPSKGDRVLRRTVAGSLEDGPCR